MKDITGFKNASWEWLKGLLISTDLVVKRVRALYPENDDHASLRDNDAKRETEVRSNKELSKLECPIVPVYAILEAKVLNSPKPEYSEEAFIVTNYCPNGTLGDLIKKAAGKGAAMSESRLRRILADTASALECMHKAKMGHCDVQGENFLFNSSDKVLVNWDRSRNPGLDTRRNDLTTAFQIFDLEDVQDINSVGCKNAPNQPIAPQAKDIYDLGNLWMQLIFVEKAGKAQSYINSETVGLFQLHLIWLLACTVHLYVNECMIFQRLPNFPTDPKNRIVTSEMRTQLHHMLNWGAKEQPTMEQVHEWIKDKNNKIYK